MTRRVPDWTSAFAWGAPIVSAVGVIAGIATWSWRGLGMAAVTTAALFALLMLAVWIYGRKL